MTNDVCVCTFIIVVRIIENSCTWKLLDIQINIPSHSTHKWSVLVVISLIFLYTMIQFLDSFEKNVRIKPVMRVKGKFGPLIPNPEASPGKKMLHLF